MLVPDATLSALPLALGSSSLGTLGLLIGLPALVILTVFGLAYLRGPSSADASQKPVDEPDSPLWLGERAPRALESGRVESGLVDSGPRSSQTGGASARW